jgi:hypothetical protein
VFSDQNIALKSNSKSLNNAERESSSNLLPTNKRKLSMSDFEEFNPAKISKQDLNFDMVCNNYKPCQSLNLVWKLRIKREGFTKN